MSRIDGIFARLAAERRRTIIPFVCGGHPRPGVTADALRALDDAGAAVIEVGIPFSDPIADGPVIAAAMHRSLGAGSTPRTVLDEIRIARAGGARAGIVAMVSVSLVLRMGGPLGFASAAADAGVDGLIVPDAPLEESGPLIDAARARGLSLALMVAPTTPAPRAAAIARASTGFVYALARTGITGERADAPDIAGLVSTIRAASSIPIACGFGISTPEHVRAVVTHADAAIVGSAIVRRMESAAESGIDPAEAAAEFVRVLASGLH